MASLSAAETRSFSRASACSSDPAPRTKTERVGHAIDQVRRHLEVALVRRDHLARGRVERAKPAIDPQHALPGPLEMQPGGPGLRPWTAATSPKLVTIAYSVSSTATRQDRPSRTRPSNNESREQPETQMASDSVHLAMPDSSASRLVPERGLRSTALSAPAGSPVLQDRRLLQRQPGEDQPLGPADAAVEDQLGLAGETSAIVSQKSRKSVSDGAAWRAASW